MSNLNMITKRNISTKIELDFTFESYRFKFTMYRYI